MQESDPTTSAPSQNQEGSTEGVAPQVTNETAQAQPNVKWYSGPEGSYTAVDEDGQEVDIRFPDEFEG